MNVNKSCASFRSGTHPLVFCQAMVYVTSVVAIDLTKCTLPTLLVLTFFAVSGVLMRRHFVLLTNTGKI